MFLERKTTNYLQHKDKLVALQIKRLEQEVEINKVKKRNVILEEEKLKLKVNLCLTLELLNII